MGGAIGEGVAEPNDGWCNEDCGALRLDIPVRGRSAYSGVLTEFWNDFSCNIHLPFACEISKNIWRCFLKSLDEANIN